MTQNRNHPVRDLLKPSEVAELFRVDPKTVTRWAAARKISSLKTPGGHRRFPVADVEALLAASFSLSVAEERRRQLAQMIVENLDGS